MLHTHNLDISTWVPDTDHHALPPPNHDSLYQGLAANGQRLIHAVRYLQPLSNMSSTPLGYETIV